MTATYTRYFADSTHSGYVDLPTQAHAFLKKANRGELSVKLGKTEIQGIATRLTSLSDVLLLVILTVNASTAGLFFALMGNQTPSLVAAGSGVLLSLLSIIRLLKR